jgi:histidyl-tRNA synthetase
MAAAGLTPDEQAAAYDRLLDGDLAVIEEVEARLPSLNSPLRTLFDGASQPPSFIASVRASLGDAIPGVVAALNELDAVAGTLGRFGVEPRVDAVLARNFEYYTGVVFKIFVDGERVITGGRYDGLLELVSGTAAPASGFGLYVRNTAALASGAGERDGRRLLILAEDDSPEILVDAYSLAERLRDQGWRVDTIDDGSGQHSACVTVRAGTNRFTVALDGSTNSFDDGEAVVRAIGAPK